MHRWGWLVSCCRVGEKKSAEGFRFGDVVICTLLFRDGELSQVPRYLTTQRIQRPQRPWRGQSESDFSGPWGMRDTDDGSCLPQQ